MKINEFRLSREFGEIRAVKDVLAKVLASQVDRGGNNVEALKRLNNDFQALTKAMHEDVMELVEAED